MVSSILFGNTNKTTTGSKEGYVLLTDMFAVIIKGLNPNNKTKINYDKVLTELYNKSKKFKEDKKIDTIFYNRYTELLLGFKFATQDSNKDPERLLWTFVNKRIVRYIELKGGVKSDIKDLKKMYFLHGNIGLGSFVSAAFNEIVDLHIYLSTKNDRKKIFSDYMKIAKNKV